MLPAWLHEAEEINANNESLDPIIGIAVCLVDASVPATHSGIVFRESSDKARLLHFAFQATVSEDAFPDSRHKYYWTRLNIDSDRASAAAGLCRRVVRRSKLFPREYPYGIHYEGGNFASNGMIQLVGKEIGLTCASFVLAVLGNCGYDLVNISTWPPSYDEKWHNWIVSILEGFARDHPHKVEQGHVDGVRNEKTCTRVRPEEVVAAANCPWPANHSDVQPGAQRTRSFLLA
jgi:hypothetical protein